MKLMCIDGNSLINRAFYGVRPLTTKSGIHTNAVFGFLNTYFKLLDDHKPDGVCVCFDLREKTFRHLKFEDYKGTRKGMPEELAMQIPYIKEILDALGVPRTELAGFEADDILGTLSQLCEAQGQPCVVVTGDKDSLQLIGQHTVVSIVSTRMGQTTTKNYDQAAFMEEYQGLTPDKIIDLKAIMGDKSDNIPGVAGIGEKGAFDLLVKFGSLEGVYQNLDSDQITKGTLKKLEEGKDMAFLSHELATIQRDIPIDSDLTAYHLKPRNDGALYNLLATLELFSVIKRMNLSPDKSQPVQAAAAVEMPVFCTEISKLNLEKPLGLSVESDFSAFALSDGEQVAVLEDGAQLLQILQSDYKIALHDSKGLYKYCIQKQIIWQATLFDTQIAQYLLSPTDSGYPLEKTLLLRFGHELTGQESNGQGSLFDQMGNYQQILAEKAFFTQKLQVLLQEELEKEGMARLFWDIEMPLVPVLAQMECNGILCDKAALTEMGNALNEKIEALSTEIYRLAGTEFNIASPKQLGEVLFTRLQLKGGKKTKTGYSTDADTLEKLMGEHPVVEKILEYRGHSKLKSTYCDGLIKAIEADGRVRTSFNQMVTATGRLSSQDPNLQNIPIRTEEGGLIRKAFYPPAGWVFLDADYSQIELRVLAHIAGDEQMIAAFRHDTDIHTAVASQVFHVPADEVTPTMRRRAKAVNFGIVYGISAFSLAEDIGVFVSEAQDYINNYFAVYSGIKHYMDKVKADAHEQGYVTTMFDRKRALPELTAAKHNIRSFGERVALNMPIQGAAADIMKIAMIHVAQRLKAEGLKTKMLLQVHDELVLESPEDEADRAAAILKQEMEQAVQLKVNLSVEVHRGYNWLEAK